jgi:UDP-2-acetamido-2,6-beta-L-arabino-hexul-4-ose reductase
LDSGQFSISTTKPGDIVRGNHYHNTKNEKFLVVKGEAVIELRHIFSDEVIEYRVSDKKIEIEEMILFIWANEIYDPQKPDTYFLKV